MDRIKLIELLDKLNANDPTDCAGDLNVLCEINVAEICKLTRFEPHDLTELVDDVHRFNRDDSTAIWKYICLNFRLLNELRNMLDSSAPEYVLSVQQSKTLRNVFRNIAGIGICCNLQTNIPRYRALPTKYVDDIHSPLNSYNRLAGTTQGIVTCMKCAKLRGVILIDNLKTVLSSLYQILYCPLKKSSGSRAANDSGFVMTEEIYGRLVEERKFFKLHLEYIANSVHKNTYVRQTMMLVEASSPGWLQKAVSHNLNAILRGPRGVETISRAMLETTVDYDDDTAKTWKVYEVIAKLIVSCHNEPDFRENICNQLLDLLLVKSRQDCVVAKPFENIFVLCVKKLYSTDAELCENVLLPAILNPFIYLTTAYHKFSDDEDITESISQAVRLTYLCVIENNPDLPIGTFTPAINAIFRLHSATLASSLKTLSSELRDVIVKYLERGSNRAVFVALDSFLFDVVGEEKERIKKVRDDLWLEVKGESMIVRRCEHKIRSDVSKSGETVRNLCKNNKVLSAHLFTYLLHCLNERDKYFKITGNKDLLNLESGFVVDEAIERNLVVYQLLSSLAEDKEIQNCIGENPSTVIQYVENVLRKTVDGKLHLTTEYESEGFQTAFTIMMILQALVMNASTNNLMHYKKLLDILKTMSSETFNKEFRSLINSIIQILTNEPDALTKGEETKTELDRAIEDVCDPLLPVRGHGLMVLAKLVEKRDKDVMERKHYVLNVFQQNLKNEDSFIYLSAIGGLAAMADVFPDSVITTLTDEYSQFVRTDLEDCVELRMKLGEVLVRVTRNLGEMSSKYKTVLLNTFLAGTKDDDHLMRASSLSNLGEICKVLGYKLGTIVTEVLICVHAVITTDKAVEARRAAVTVIRQLLAGLESEMVAFLKEDMLEIYRTLKTVYHNDRDDVMRLQAQLALEELNENMRNFVFPKPQLNPDKNVVMLN